MDKLQKNIVVSLLWTGLSWLLSSNSARYDECYDDLQSSIIFIIYRKLDSRNGWDDVSSYSTTGPSLEYAHYE